MTSHEPRSIIHLNITSFSVAVERVCDSSLQSRPVVVVPALAPRTVVYDMSEEAYLDGVRVGMPLESVRRFCRKAIVIPYNLSLYRRAMKAVCAKAAAFSPLVEVPDDKGHVFLDVTGSSRLLGPSAGVADQICKLIAKDINLHSAWSVAANKLVAKAASRTVKPHGQSVVEPGSELSFLAPLPVGLLPHITAQETKLMRELRMNNVGQVAELSLPQLRIIFGQRANFVHEAVRGIDPSPVAAFDQKRNIISLTHYFSPPSADSEHVGNILFGLVAEAGMMLRNRNLAVRRVGVEIHYQDAQKVIRQASDSQGVFDDICLFAMAQKAMHLAWKRRATVCCLQLHLDRLAAPSCQVLLVPELEMEKQKKTRLFAALDKVREQCGYNSIKFGKGMRILAMEH